MTRPIARPTAAERRHLSSPVRQRWGSNRFETSQSRGAATSPWTNPRSSSPSVKRMPPLRGSHCSLKSIDPNAHALGYLDVAAPRLETLVVITRSAPPTPPDPSLTLGMTAWAVDFAVSRGAAAECSPGRQTGVRGTSQICVEPRRGDRSVHPGTVFFRLRACHHHRS